MTITSAGGGLRATAAWVRGWPFWSLPVWSRTYITVVVAAAAAALGAASAHTPWHASQFGVFLLLLGGAAAMLEATRTVHFPQGTLTRDLQEVWFLAVAILLPPVFALIAPIPLVAMKQWRVQRGVAHRRVFSAAAIGLGYGAASLEFHDGLTPLLSGPPAAGAGALGWLGATIAAALTGWLVNAWLVVGAVKLTDRRSRVGAMMFSREGAATDAAVICLAVLVALALRFSLAALVLAVPVVLMQKRFLMHAQLLAEARTDAKTSLLNAAAWQREAATELTRAGRFRPPPAIAIIDIDHFKAVNDAYGHLAGDRVLRVIAGRLKAQLRDGDVIGRFGGEEFAVLLPRTGTAEARRVAERLRARIDDEPIAVGDGRSDGVLVHVTISVGLAEPGHACDDLDELLATADAALYDAKHAGRNRVCVLAPATAVSREPVRGETAAGEVMPSTGPGQVARAPQ